MNRSRRAPIFGGLLVTLLLCAWGAPAPDSFHFAILGDRTGEAQRGVYEQVWKELAAESPAFVVSVGDTIQGMSDTTAEAEWQQAGRIFQLFGRYPLYLAPGNHDVSVSGIGAPVPAVRRTPSALQFRLRAGAFHHPRQ